MNGLKLFVNFHLIFVGAVAADPNSEGGLRCSALSPPSLPDKNETFFFTDSIPNFLVFILEDKKMQVS